MLEIAADMSEQNQLHAAVPHLDNGSFAATSQPRVGRRDNGEGGSMPPFYPRTTQGADQILKS